MRAIGYQHTLPIADPASLVDIDLLRPVPADHDLLVAVHAISVNPVDTKVRNRDQPQPGAWRVLGYDAAGIVEAVGPAVTRFRPGEAVFYAGALDRPGSNAQFQLVDERIVGHKPQRASMAQAAALPLTAITAWEMLFDRIDIRRPVIGAANAVLIIGGAGGVGSIATQLARQLTGLTIITTASRPETRAWSLDLGAHHVLDHSADLPAQCSALGLGAPAFVFSTTHSNDHLPAIAALIAPQGRLGVIDIAGPVEIPLLLMRKCISIHWEFMFTRSMFATADIAEQGRLLDEVARLVDAGTLETTLSETLGPIDAATLRTAHARLESGQTIGKIVLEGWA